MGVFRNDILELSTKLMNCVLKDDIIGAKCLFYDITDKADRKSIVAKKRNGCNAPLFEAALRGNAAMVSFLVKECYADLEERGRYYNNKLMTPLLLAAILDHFEVVKCLIDLGADINAVSFGGCTPVLFACDNSSPAVAEYLIRRGADIKKPNKSGGTCLMKAVKFKELCQLLLDNGADVKAKDENGDLALHYAIEENQPDTVQLLLDHGSDPYLRNEAGDDAFQTASIGGKELILKELLFNWNPPVQRWIESCQLLGGYFIVYGDETDKAINFWKDAVDIQQMNSGFEIISSKPNPVYLFAQEVNTVEELEARNRESVHMYSLMIRERILGPNHYHTIRGLLGLGKRYKYNGGTRRCIDIWKYALHLQNSFRRQMTDLYFEIIYDLCCLFYELYEASRQSNSSVDQRILIKDSLDVLEMATVMLELIFESKHAEEISKKEYNLMMFILLIIRVITELDMNVHQVLSFRNIVHRLVRCRPRTDHGRTLLQFSIFPNRYISLYKESILPFPCIAVVELLLECGANVNDVDGEHNTALHLCSKAIRNLVMKQHHDSINITATLLSKQHRDLMKRIAELLLKNGAHVDMVNKDGHKAVDSLTSSWLDINMLDFVNLRCLAARVVMQYKIPYVGHIPALLESFVQMHGTLKG